MPDQEGKLTQTEKSRLADWYQKNWNQSFKCPVCQSDKWTTAEHTVEAPVYRGGTMIIGGEPHYPLVAVFSIPCGYTVFMNAAIMGILDPPPGTPTPPTENVEVKNG